MLSNVNARIIENTLKIERTLPKLPILKMLPVLPMLKILAVLPIERMLPVLAMLHKLATLAIFRLFRIAIIPYLPLSLSTFHSVKYSHLACIRRTRRAGCGRFPLALHRFQHR